MFWESLLTHFVASHLSWCCAVFLALFRVREGGVCFVVCFLCCIDWSSLVLQEDFCRCQVKDNWCWIRAGWSSWTQRVPSMYLLASMLFFFLLLFNYVENYRYCYTWFDNSLHKIMWNTVIAFISISLKYLHLIIELTVSRDFFIFRLA